MAKSDKTNSRGEFMPTFLEEAGDRTYRAFYKWGRKDYFYAPSSRSRVFGYLRDALGLSDDFFRVGNYANENVRLDKTATSLDNKDIDKLREIVGEENVSIDLDARISASITKKREEWTAIRSGKLPPIVDAVVSPASDDEIVAVLAYAKKRKLAVVVKSALTPKTAGKKTIALDLTCRYNQIVAFNEVDSYVTVEAGMALPILEDIMNNAPDNFKDYNIENKFTIGHFPVEYEECTIYDALMGINYGIESGYFGTFDDIALEREYASADGISTEYSEGAIPCRAKLRIAKYYPHNRYGFAYMFRSFQEAVNAMREICQKGGALPVEIRLSDAKETSLLMRYYLLDDSIADGILTSFKVKDGERCLLVGFSGGPYTYSRLAYNNVKSIAKKYRAMSMTSFMADAFADSRFNEMYVREMLEDFSLHTESVQYPLSWTELPEKHATVATSESSEYVRSRIIAPTRSGAVMEVVTIKE